MLPPGLDGYMATRQAQAQDQQQQFQMIQGLMQMQGQQEDRAMKQQMFPLQVREQEAKLKKMDEEAKMNAQLGPLMANGGAGLTPEQYRAVGMRMALGGHQGSAAWLANADRMEQRTRDQATMEGMQSRPGVTPVTPNDDDGNQMPSIAARPGAFGALSKAPYPAIAQAAQGYQQQVNAGTQGMTPTQANAHLDRLTNLYTTQAGQDARLDKRQDQRIEIRNMGPTGDTSPYTNVQSDGKGGFVGLNKRTMRMEAVPMAPGATMAGYGQLPPGSANLTGQAFLDSLPPSDAALVKSVAEGRTSIKDLSTKGGHREAIIKLANQFMPGFDPVSNSQVTAAMSTLERQRGLVMTYEKTAIGGANIALEMSDKVDRTGSPIINKWINAGRKNVLGDPDVTRLNNAVETFTNEYAKVMSGSSGGQATTVSMQQHAREMLSGAMTKDQFKQTVDLMKREMTETRETAFDKQITEMRGRVRNSGATATTSEPAKPASPAQAARRKYNPATGKIE